MEKQLPIYVDIEAVAATKEPPVAPPAKRKVPTWAFVIVAFLFTASVFNSGRTFERVMSLIALASDTNMEHIQYAMEGAEEVAIAAAAKGAAVEGGRRSGCKGKKGKHGARPYWWHPLRDHPHGDHPHGDHPHGDHPHGDHPHGDHPHGDHPHGDHPHGDHPHHRVPKQPRKPKQPKPSKETKQPKTALADEASLDLARVADASKEGIDNMVKEIKKAFNGAKDLL